MRPAAEMLEASGTSGTGHKGPCYGGVRWLIHISEQVPVQAKCGKRDREAYNQGVMSTDYEPPSTVRGSLTPSELECV